VPPQHKNRRPIREIANPLPTPSAPVERESGPHSTTVFVLGAGADVSYGIPMVGTLLRELARFARDEGKGISAALKAELPYLRFTFDRFAGDQASSLISSLFDRGNDVNLSLESAVTKLKSHGELRALGVALGQLCEMARLNELQGVDVAGLAHIVGSAAEVPDATLMLDPQHISLETMFGQAMPQSFERALLENDLFDVKEHDALELFITSASNIEELLSRYFRLFSGLGSPHDQKTYLYLPWMLWAFLRHKSGAEVTRSGTLYAHLSAIADDVITFNYTDFFDAATRYRVTHFHGDLHSYLRCDDRSLVRIPGLSHSGDLRAIQNVVSSLRLDVRNYPAVDIPAIVPPLSFKPVMSRTQLLAWAGCDTILQAANRIVVVGYSFATADEHFNDLLRHTKSSTRIIVINPDLVTTPVQACRALALDPAWLTAARTAGRESLSLDRLICLKATADEVDQRFYESLFTN
jgi:hypothetical protein